MQDFTERKDLFRIGGAPDWKLAANRCLADPFNFLSEHAINRSFACLRRSRELTDVTVALIRWRHSH